MRIEKMEQTDNMSDYVTIKRNLGLIESKFEEIEHQLSIETPSIVMKQLIQELKDLII
jgi:hypothetical protein